jgi:lysozyme family protein
MTFDEALRQTLEFECGGDPREHDGYVNDPADPGGETKYGIAKRYYPRLDIANLTYDQARRLYYAEYWQRYKCDLVPEHIRGTWFDMLVIPGPGAAGRLLQRAYNSLGVSAPLVVDGIVGLKTLTASIDVPVDRLRLLRLEYFAEVVIRLPDRRRYWNGWKRRAMAV